MEGYRGTAVTIPRLRPTLLSCPSNAVHGGTARGPEFHYFTLHHSGQYFFDFSGAFFWKNFQKIVEVEFCLVFCADEIHDLLLIRRHISLFVLGILSRRMPMVVRT